MKTNALTLCVLSVALAGGCAHPVPPELVNARLVYERTSSGPAAQLVPAEVHKAQMALTDAEQAFQDAPRAAHTRDLAYVAERKAQMADALASIAADQQKQELANQDLLKTQSAMVAEAKGQLQDTQGQLQQTQANLAATEAARAEAEKRPADAMTALSKLAAVKQEKRGLVITLSGSVLFSPMSPRCCPTPRRGSTRSPRLFCRRAPNT